MTHFQIQIATLVIGGFVIALTRLWVRHGLATQKKIQEAVAPEHWHGIGSDRRYDPKFEEAVAYVQGLNDANRIIEIERSREWHTTPPEVKSRMKAAEVAIHHRAEVIKRRFGS